MSQISFQETRNSIARYMLADGMSPIVDLEKSHGSWLVDGNTGKGTLDCIVDNRAYRTDVS